MSESGILAEALELYRLKHPKRHSFTLFALLVFVKKCSKVFCG